MSQRAPVPDRAPNVPGHSPAAPCPCAPPPKGGHPGHGHGPGSKSQPTVPPAPVGVTAALRNALRLVNAAFNRLSPEAQAQVDVVYSGLDREVDAAIVSGDRERALAAIRAWREHWEHEIGARL